MRKLVPNFFVVGAGKAGTTSLYHYLRQHPQIFMSPVKEPCYFASEIRIENMAEPFKRGIRRLSRNLPGILGDLDRANPTGWLVSEWEDYLRLFRDVRTEIAIGEATASYLWSETAAAGISKRIPDAKIVMILRDPAERAFSQYLHQSAAGLTCDSFRGHLERCVRGNKREISVFYPLLEAGLYYQQVRRYLDRFDKDQIRIYWYEEAWSKPTQFLANLFEFLDVDATFRPDLSHKSLERRAPRFPAINHAIKRFEGTHRLSSLTPSWVRYPIRKFLVRQSRDLTMDTGDRKYLIDYYREDIEKLATLLNRDLSAWLR